MLILYYQWFNAYESNDGEDLKVHHVRPGDFLVHFAGVVNRDDHMAKWCDISNPQNPQWNQVPTHTNDTGETRRFWEDYKIRKLNMKQRLEDSKTLLQALIEEASTTSEKWQPNAAPEDSQSFETILEDCKAISDLFSNSKDGATTEEDVRMLEATVNKMQTVVERIRGMHSREEK